MTRWLLRYSGILAVGVAIALYWPSLGIPIFLVVMGGALAYIGDQLGIYWGKKRISIFGLRPKQTAVVISVLTGLMITLLTLMVASYLNENVKIALFEIDTLLERQAQLLKEQRDILRNNEALRAKNSSIQEEADRLQAEKQGLEKVKASLLDEKGELEKKIAEVEESLLRLKEDKQKKIAEIERLSNIVEKKETALVAIHKGQPLIETPVMVQLSAGPEEISRVVLTMLADLRESIESKGVKIDEKSFDRAESKLRSSLAAELGRMAENFDKDGIQVTECAIQPVSLRNVSIGESLQSVKFRIKPNMPIFGKDEEVARTVIDGRLPEERILDQLFYFDKQVISVLREKGVSHTSLRIRERKISARQLVNFYRIVKLVRELGRPVMVRFVTRSPVNSYGEIDAVYKVEELPGPWTPKGRVLGSTMAGVSGVENDRGTKRPSRPGTGGTVAVDGKALPNLDTDDGGSVDAGTAAVATPSSVSSAAAPAETSGKVSACAKGGEPASRSSTSAGSGAVVVSSGSGSAGNQGSGCASEVISSTTASAVTSAWRDGGAGGGLSRAYEGHGYEAALPMSTTSMPASISNMNRSTGTAPQVGATSGTRAVAARR